MSEKRAVEEPAVVSYSREEMATRFAVTSSQSEPCDRNLKENVKKVDEHEVLSRLSAIPIATWNYRSDDPGVRHMGPMAQDFHAAFQVGEDDRHIHTIDASGVALAAIQALYELNLQKAEHIAKMETRLQWLENEVATLRAQQYANGAL